MIKGILPVRLRLSRRKGFDLQALSRSVNGLPARSVARPGLYGNWWSVGLRACGCRSAGECTHNTFCCATAEEAVALFRQELEIRIGAMPEKYQPKLEALRGHNLACWCKPGAACHADVWLEIANRAPEAGAE
jgi:hypothetical protein